MTTEGSHVGSLLNGAGEFLLNNLFTAERGNLGDHSKLLRLRYFIDYAKDRIWAEGTLDMRVLSSLMFPRNKDIDIVVRENPKKKHPFLVIDRMWVGFDGDKYLLLKKPSNYFLKQFEERFSDKSP